MSLKISLCMISKNEEAHLAKTLETIKPFVDEIVLLDTGSSDKTVEIAKKYGCRVDYYVWKKDFADARNVSFKLATGDVILWLDCDDLFRGGEKLRKIVEAEFSKPLVSAIMLPYRYQFDDYGNCVSEFYRERIVRRDAGVWKGRLHETWQMLEDGGVVQVADIWVDHDTTNERIKESQNRNLFVLEQEINDTKPNVDVRTMFSYGKALLGLGKNDAAVGWLEEFVKRSGWPEERYQATCVLARVYKDMSRYSDAIDTAMRALKQKPDWPDAHLVLGEIYCNLEQWDKAITWAKHGMALPRPNTDLLTVNPRDYDLNPLIVLQRAYFEANAYIEAIQCIDAAMKFLPNQTELLERRRHMVNVMRDRDLAAAVERVKGALLAEGDKEKLAYLAKSLPKRVEDFPFKHFPKVGVLADRPTIAFYCPSNGTKPWGPLSVKDGIGGSEEAVIELSKRLAKRGWDVTVMADTKENGVVDGVTWRPYFNYDPNAEEYDVWVVWRDVEFLDLPFTAKQAYVWLHDLQVHKEAWSKARIAKLDAAIVLSKWHRNEIAQVPDSKVWISRNGIVPEHFTEQTVKREPWRCIYSSAPNRGLEFLLRNWGSLRAVRPEATLHVYYGWEIFDALNRNNPSMLKWKQEMLALLDQEGVTDHGRVGHAEIARAFLASSYWLYPCFVFDEISCITAMKAQMARCTPIVATRAALAETVRVGAKCQTQEEWLQVAKDALEQGWAVGPQENIPDFSWDGVAAEWDARFKAKMPKKALELVK